MPSEGQQNSMPLVHMLQSYFSMAPPSADLPRADVVCFTAGNSLIRSPDWARRVTEHLADNTPLTTSLVTSLERNRDINTTDVGLTCVHSSHAKIIGDTAFFPSSFLAFGDGTHHLRWLVGIYQRHGRANYMHKELMVEHNGTKQKRLDLYRSMADGTIVRGKAIEAERLLLEIQINMGAERIRRAANALPLEH